MPAFMPQGCSAGWIWSGISTALSASPSRSPTNSAGNTSLPRLPMMHRKRRRLRCGAPPRASPRGNDKDPNSPPCMRPGPCCDPWAPVEPPSRGPHATDHLVERTRGPRRTPPNGIGHLWASSLAAAGVLKRQLSHGGLRRGGDATGWARAVQPRPVPRPGGAGLFRRRGRRASRRSRGAPRSRDRRVPPAAP